MTEQTKPPRQAYHPCHDCGAGVYDACRDDCIQRRPVSDAAAPAERPQTICGCGDHTFNTSGKCDVCEMMADREQQRSWLPPETPEAPWPHPCRSCGGDGGHFENCPGDSAAAPEAPTLRSLAVYLGWGPGMTPQEVFDFVVERERLLRVTQNLLETHKSHAATAEGAIRERIQALALLPGARETPIAGTRVSEHGRKAESSRGGWSVMDDDGYPTEERHDCMTGPDHPMPYGAQVRALQEVLSERGHSAFWKVAVVEAMLKSWNLAAVPFSGEGS